MKKMLAVVALLVFMVAPAFAGDTIIFGTQHNDTTNEGGAGGAGGNATGGSVINSGNPKIYNTPINIVEGSKQKTEQMNDWIQTFEAPRDLLPAPSIAPPQVQILPGKMWRVAANEIPNIGIPQYNGEEYIKAVSYNGSVFNRVRREDVAEDLLTFRDRVLGRVGWIKSQVRLEVIARDAGESTSSSGSGAGSGSFNATPASGMAGTLGIFPGIARWKADYQYTVVFYLLK